MAGADGLLAGYHRYGRNAWDQRRIAPETSADNGNDEQDWRGVGGCGRRSCEEAGGKLVTPKTAIPTGGYFAYLEATEGNLFGVMQPDKNAK